VEQLPQTIRGNRFHFSQNQRGLWRIKMKLADIYTPSAHRIPNNGLYEYYQDYLLDGLREPEERDPIKETITSDYYQYRINEKEREFFEEYYVPQGSILDVKQHTSLQSIFGDYLEKIVVSEHLKDMLDFIEIPDNLGLLIAPIGWGKTVLLRYVWFFLIGKSELLQKLVIPVYISIDHNRNLFRGNISTTHIREMFSKEILHERLIDVVAPFTELDDERFWDYVKKGSDRFNTLEQYEHDVRKIHKDDTATIDSKILTARMEMRKANDFYYIALKYLRNQLGKVPLLLLDNVDTLSLEVNQVIIDEAIFLSKEYNVKILISMRTPTYGKIEESRDGSIRAYPPVKIVMEKINVQDYIKFRARAIRQKIRASKPQFKYLNYHGDIRVTFKDGAKVFDAMLDKLLTDESSNVLSHVAFYNLRKINTLVLKYLASGYVDEHSLVKRIIEEEVTDEKYGKSPLWILLSSVITGNNKTRFSEMGIPYQEGVLNLYCNGRNYRGEYLIRTHILNYVKRHSDTNMQEILDIYSSLYDVPPQTLFSNFTYAIWRLLYFDLLESPDHYKIDSYEEINQIKTLTLTDTGEYYRREFRNYYEYLAYMKDDIELIDNLVGMQDCIKVGDLPGRYNEVNKFLRIIFENEKKLLFDLNKDQRICFFQNFSNPEDSNPFITFAPTVNMIDFGKHRTERKSLNIELYESLLMEIIQNVDTFKKTLLD
jgi:hypothetical protein